MAAAGLRFALHDGVDQVIRQHGVLTEGIKPLTEDVDGDKRAKSERIDEQAGAFKNFEHKRCEGVEAAS